MLYSVVKIISSFLIAHAEHVRSFTIFLLHGGGTVGSIEGLLERHELNVL